jgi:hypothetical protein
MQSVLFHGSAYTDFCEWAEIDEDIFLKIQEIAKILNDETKKHLLSSQK